MSFPENLSYCVAVQQPLFGLELLEVCKIIVSTTQEFDSILDIVMNRTGLNFYYNYLLSEQPKDFTYYPQWLERPQVRKAIHVGNLTYDDVSMKVHQYLNDDMLKSIRPWLEALLEADYKVLNNYFADCCNQIRKNTPNFIDYFLWNITCILVGFLGCQRGRV